jgi:pimeloyl-ACP methyl ester carboxylesterase
MKMLTFVFALLFLACSGCINDLVLRPAFDEPYNPADFGYRYDEVNLPLDGSYVQIWHIYSEESKALAVIIPGSDANKSRYTEAAPLFIDKGIDLIVMDYPGYGNSPGPKSVENCIRGARAVVDYAVTQHPHVFVLGFSLGTPIATRLAADHRLDGVFLEGVLVMKEYMAYFDGPLGFLADIIYVRPQMPPDMDIKQYITQVDEPKLFFNSPQDTITPMDGALAVYELAAEPKEFEVISGEHGRMAKDNPEWWSDHVTSWMLESIQYNDGEGE